MEAWQWGLTPGNAALQERMRTLQRKKRGQDELNWLARVERGSGRGKTAQALAGDQPERPLQAWVRVELRSENRVDVARDNGYKDGGTITRMPNNLKKKAAQNPAVAGR